MHGDDSFIQSLNESVGSSFCFTFSNTFGVTFANIYKFTFGNTFSFAILYHQPYKQFLSYHQFLSYDVPDSRTFYGYSLSLPGSISPAVNSTNSEQATVRSRVCQHWSYEGTMRVQRVLNALLHILHNDIDQI